MNHPGFSGDKVIWGEEKMKNQVSYSLEVRERTARLVFEQQKDHESRWSAIESIVSKIDCATETFRTWVRRAETDQGIRGGPVVIGSQTAQAAGTRESWAEAYKRNIAQGIDLLCAGGARPPTEVMVVFADQHKEQYETKPIYRKIQMPHWVIMSTKGTLEIQGVRCDRKCWMLINRSIGSVIEDC